MHAEAKAELACWLRSNACILERRCVLRLLNRTACERSGNDKLEFIKVSHNFLALVLAHFYCFSEYDFTWLNVQEFLRTNSEYDLFIL